MSYEQFLIDRTKSLGASDVGILTGNYTDKTPIELWKEKTGRTPIDFSQNYITTRGHNLEPAAREAYCMLHGNFENFSPIKVTDPEYDFFTANLDGYNPIRKRVLEIKNPWSEAIHDRVGQGIVKPEYIDQVQHQLMCTADAIDSHFWSWSDRQKTGHLVTFQRSKDWVEEWRPFLIDWWQTYVIGDTQPPLTDRDWLTIEDMGMKESFAQLEDMKQNKKEFKLLRDVIVNSDVFQHMIEHHPRLLISNAKVSRTKKGVMIRWKKN